MAFKDRLKNAGIPDKLKNISIPDKVTYGLQTVSDKARTASDTVKTAADKVTDVIGKAKDIPVVGDRLPIDKLSSTVSAAADAARSVADVSSVGQMAADVGRNVAAAAGDKMKEVYRKEKAYIKRCGYAWLILAIAGVILPPVCGCPWYLCLLVVLAVLVVPPVVIFFLCKWRYMKYVNQIQGASVKLTTSQFFKLYKTLRK